MKTIKTFSSCLVTLLLAACASQEPLPDNFDDMPEDLQVTLMDFLSPEQTAIWGEEARASGTHTLVRYLDDFHTQVTVNFESGYVQVQTRGGDEPLQQLRQAIVGTLLTPADPRIIDLYTATDFGLTGKPFLQGQVVDQDGQAIGTQWRAQRFADYLVQQKLKRTGPGYEVVIPMVRQHTLVAAGNYRQAVSQAAARYRVSVPLIYAVIDTESSFNPLAVSPSNAYGLMQIMPRTAGHDVMTKIYGRNTIPTRDYLMVPENNIDMGAAYLSILRDNYLSGIQDPLTREYCAIASYNGGAGNLLRTFSSDTAQAKAKINRMSSDQVYRYILKHHPREETRNYLRKVTEKKQRYAGMG
ncbi:MAG: lytic murein transglycosylase [Oceanospirillaceae bacterium]|nr:lytic murein transglycosylase [Oceanospirillaceae bacterium]|tara:strand:+ start:1572 stop:2639 length:1068 start_codon:yes stop_codon:yes gene_type:complete